MIQMHNEDNIKDVQAFTEREDIFAYLDDIVKDHLDADGLNILYYDEEKYYLFSRTNALTLLELPASLSHEFFGQDDGIVLNNVMERKEYFQQIDNPENENLSALLFAPTIDVENRKVLLSFYKTLEKEKEQVVMPLIVGSQVIGVTTKSQSIVTHKSFEENDLKKVVELIPFFSQVLKRLFDIEQLTKKNQANEIIDALDLNSVEKSVKYFYAKIETLKAPLNNLKLLQEKVQDSVHKTDLSYPLIEEMSLLLKQIDDIIEGMTRKVDPLFHELNFERNNKVNTEEYFTSLYRGVYSNACGSGLNPIIFLDPTLKNEIVVPKDAFSTFFIQLTSMAIKDADKGMKMEFRIQNSEREHMISFLLGYKKSNMSEENIREYQRLFYTSFTDGNFNKPLYQAYRELHVFGARAAVNYTKVGTLFYRVDLPCMEKSEKHLVESVQSQSIKIGIIFTKSCDLDSVNNIARYLLGMKIEKENILVSEKFHSIYKEIRHLIIFESQLNEDMLEILKTEYHGKILLVGEGCNNENGSLIDYSIVDGKIEKGQICLHEIYEFLEYEVI